jgi:hypothetical protein
MCLINSNYLKYVKSDPHFLLCINPAGIPFQHRTVFPQYIDSTNNIQSSCFQNQILHTKKDIITSLLEPVHKHRTVRTGSNKPAMEVL